MPSIVGKNATVVRDIQTPEGMVYRNTEVLVLDKMCSCTHGEKNIQIEDNAGRRFWVGSPDILIS